jgi:peptide chain release factor 1
MLDKLEAIYNRFKQVEETLSQPDVVADMKRFTQLNREYKGLQAIVDKYFEYRNLVGNLAGAKEILKTEKDEEVD